MSTPGLTHRRCGAGLLRPLISLMIVFLLGRQSAFRRPLMSSLSPKSSESPLTTLFSQPTVSSLVAPTPHQSKSDEVRNSIIERIDGLTAQSGRIIGGNSDNIINNSITAIAEKLSNSLASIKAAMTTNSHTAVNDIISTTASKVHVTNMNDSHISCRMPHESEWLLLLETSATPNPAGNTKSNNDMTMIPKILHKVIITANGGFPSYLSAILDMMSNETMRLEYINNNNNNYNNNNYTGSIEEAHISWYINNPTYDIRYYDLHRCRLYLKLYYHPLFLRAFDCIEAFAGKVNFFRYLVVYHEGGYYSDWKQCCIKDGLLDYLSTHNSTKQPRWKASITTSTQPTTWFSCWGTTPSHKTMQNAFFGAMPKSPILAAAIYKSLLNIQSRADLLPNAQSLFMTGVGVLHEAIYTAAASAKTATSAVAGKKNNTSSSLPGTCLHY